LGETSHDDLDLQKVVDGIGVDNLVVVIIMEAL
jgi:hypothetical protein